ncbi:hypothetical protein V6N13_015118 [Hibiscus sabdariffa]|uniref:Uncharacterized protein n=1 Tax=Hibiscus sabdariffa TaxID=183260 RepID=A0ABR2B004_9ROSI
MNYAVHFKEKYEKALASNAEMEKRVVMAESMLEATLQYESRNPKPLTSQTRQDSSGRMGGLLSLGLWRDKRKGKPNVEEPNSSRTQEETNS